VDQEQVAARVLQRHHLAAERAAERKVAGLLPADGQRQLVDVVNVARGVAVVVVIRANLFLAANANVRQRIEVHQGCQMVYFQTKIQILGKFLRVPNGKVLVHFTALWSVLRPFGIFWVIWYILGHLVYFWSDIFSHFGMLRKEKSGNTEV
jgi:hypothetical protein